MPELIAIPPSTTCPVERTTARDRSRAAADLAAGMRRLGCDAKRIEAEMLAGGVEMDGVVHRLFELGQESAATIGPMVSAALGACHAEALRAGTTRMDGPAWLDHHRKAWRFHRRATGADPIEEADAAALAREVAELRRILGDAAAMAERFAVANLDADGEATDASSVAQCIANTIRQDVRDARIDSAFGVSG